MPWDITEILETIRMTELEHFDIRTVTMGISLRDCAGDGVKSVTTKIASKLQEYASRLDEAANELQMEYGISIANRRIAVTPIAIVGDGLTSEEMVEIARTMDQTAGRLGVDFIGGYSALIQKGCTRGDLSLIRSIPTALSQTERVCSSVNVASTKAGINMDGLKMMADVILETARATADRDGVGCAKLVVFCNIPEDNPFVAGALHGISEPEAVINVGASGPGVVLDAVRRSSHLGLGDLAEEIKRTAFKITRAGELIGRKISQRLGVPFGIVDLSLAPTPEEGDSIADILTAMGLVAPGGPGTTAALALLIDAVKRGGMMASSHVGGMSGAFIPVSEDAAMMRALAQGHMTIEKLEAMTAVCSVGLDMVPIPGDTDADTIAGIIADECAIGTANNKTTAVRVIPVPGKKPGDRVEFGGLLGGGVVVPLRSPGCAAFIRRGGRIPAPITSLRN